MSERSSHVIPLAGGCGAALLLLIWLVVRDGGSGGDLSPSGLAPESAVPAPPGHAPLGSAAPAEADRGSKPPATPLLAALRQLPLATGARPREAVLTFANAEAYRRFLARASQLGLTVLGRLDALLTVRVRYDSLAGLQSDILTNAADYTEVGANYYVNIPPTPAKQDRPAQNLVPLGNTTLAALGVTDDHRQWGRGVTIAVLDSGVTADSTFGMGRLRYLDIGLGTAAGSGPEDGHGTAVAALAAGAAEDAPGVAPAADVLSIRVTDASAQSDIFTIARAILAAADAGAQIINISLGGYETGSALTQAIDYAIQRGAVIVASAGNDQAAQLTWPAADPRVISVGAVDALEQQVYFSNAGAELKLTAPGYGVQTAWLDGQRVYFDGTSASAPLVAGAIAALMSTNPGMSAAQAVQVLQQFASDGGAPGSDPNYGNGVVNLGWAMNRNTPLYVDTAISSHYYDATTDQMEFVIQNRSGQGIGGMILSVDTSGTTTTHSIPLLGPGASYVVGTAVDQSQLKAGSGLVFRTQLANPGGVIDQVPANNRKTSTLAPPAQ
jgi:hypothetical protein